MNFRCPSPLPRTRFLRNSTLLRRTLLLIILSLLLDHSRTLSQTPPMRAEDDEVLSVRTDLITVNCFVTDAHGRRQTGLAARDFHILDNGRDATVSYFAPGTSRVALVFALDASGSAREHIARQREAALALLSRFGSGSRAAVLAFTDRPALALPFARDAERMRAALLIDAQPNHHTAIFDAALAAVRAFDARPDPAERRIVILLSDGLDNASATRAATVINEANVRGVSLYVIHFPLFEPSGDRLAVRAPARGFRDLAERTGGVYFLLKDAAHGLDPRREYDLGAVFGAIADDLQSQYVLGFYLDPAARAASFHKLDIKLTADKTSKLRVHALRDSYTLKQ
ncbi:MAG: VWA domain-containing protein [Pyrinomonadaceae bacterium]